MASAVINYSFLTINYMNYIATWFYRESADEASFYPQMGQRGDSALVHSVYMQIQVPFFRTFRHYNPAARLLFFTNLRREGLPRFLLGLFDELGVETVTLPYERRPPKGWYGAWQNQFYLYDILGWMGGRMKADDALLVCDATSSSPTAPPPSTASRCPKWRRSTPVATARRPARSSLTTAGSSSG